MLYSKQEDASTGSNFVSPAGHKTTADVHGLLPPLISTLYSTDFEQNLWQNQVRFFHERKDEFSKGSEPPVVFPVEGCPCRRI